VSGSRPTVAIERCGLEPIVRVVVDGGFNTKLSTTPTKLALGVDTGLSGAIAVAERDPLEAAFIVGTVAALRKRGAVLRRKAALGITVLADRRPIVTIIASESAVSLKIADDFGRIANAIEGEGAS
jgi:hypothetical protein